MQTRFPGKRLMSRMLPLLLALLLPACAIVDDSKRNITYDNASRYYENALRWGDYEAAERVRRPAGTPVPLNKADLERIKITGYDVKGYALSEDHNEIRTEVLIRYYNQDHMTEHTITDIQTWVYDPDAKNWFITSPLPAFR